MMMAKGLKQVAEVEDSKGLDIKTKQTKKQIVNKEVSTFHWLSQVCN